MKLIHIIYLSGLLFIAGIYYLFGLSGMIFSMACLYGAVLLWDFITRGQVETKGGLI